MDIAGLELRYMHIHLLILQNYGRIHELQLVENPDGELWSVYMSYMNTFYPTGSEIPVRIESVEM